MEVKIAGIPKSNRPPVIQESSSRSRSFPQKDPTKTEGVEDGQNGPKLIDFPYSKLNRNEAKLMCSFDPYGIREVFSISDLADKSFPDTSSDKANSYVRNSLRRLVRGDWIEKIGRGEFRIGMYGIQQMRLNYPLGTVIDKLEKTSSISL